MYLESTDQQRASLFTSFFMVLSNNYIKFSEWDEDMLKAIYSFSGRSNLPFVMGNIDGTHVERNKPEGFSAIDYFSRKQKYTNVNQAICNGNPIFLAVNAGFPGSIHDSRMLEHSWIGKAVAEDTFLKSPTTYINRSRNCSIST